jgi:shikimate kinase
MNNIILIGFMGSGKTTIGGLVAKKTKRKYADLDKMIVKHAKMPIAKIFDKYGEEHFRDIESLIVKKVSKLKGYVIATGGGVVKREKNIIELKKCGKIIYLYASFNEIVGRIKERDDRPLFDVNDLKQTKKLYRSRLKIYRQAADFTVNTAALGAEKTADRIIKIAGEKC